MFTTVLSTSFFSDNSPMWWHWCWSTFQNPAQIYVRRWNSNLQMEDRLSYSTTRLQNLVLSAWPSVAFDSIVGVQQIRVPGLGRPQCFRNVYSALLWQARGNSLPGSPFLLSSLISKTSFPPRQYLFTHFHRPGRKDIMQKTRPSI